MLTDKEWFELFCKDPDEAMYIAMMESKDEPRACWKCFRVHSFNYGCYDTIPNYWMAL